MKKQIPNKKGKEPIIKATHGSSTQHILGDLEIECYVLEGGVAVLSGRGMARALGLGAGRGAQGTRLPIILGKKEIKPFISEDLARIIDSPIRFTRPGRGGTAAKGYEATTLTKICRVFLSARRAGVLEKNVAFQQIARESEAIVAAFSDAGIVSYVYEVTGYEKVKDPAVIRSMVASYLSEEIRKWSKEFPDDFFAQLDRIYHNEKTTSRNRPLYYAKFIRKYIYDPLLDGEVIKALDVKNPKNEKGVRKHRHHTLTSEEIGLPALKAQMWQVIGTLKLSSNKRKFESNYARMMGLPRQEELFD